MMKEIRKYDLHMHSNISDGAEDPQVVVDKASEAGMQVIAITDHELTCDFASLKQYAKQKKIELISGVEITTESEWGKVDIIIYEGDYSHPAYKKYVAEVVKNRKDYILERIENLNKNNYNITYEDFEKLLTSNYFTSMALSRALIEKGLARNRVEAGDILAKYGQGKLKGRRKTQDIIKLGNEIGGTPVWAHPFLCKKSQDKNEDLRLIDEMLNNFVFFGLKGIEKDYPYFAEGYNGTLSEEDIYKIVADLAEKYNIITTGGSDYHGDNKPGLYIGMRGLDTREVDVFKQVIYK